MQNSLKMKLQTERKVRGKEKGKKKKNTRREGYLEQISKATRKLKSTYWQKQMFHIIHSLSSLFIFNCM